MDKVTELAMLFRDRDNLENFQISTAVLINKSPIVLKLSETVFLSKEYENLILSETIHNKIIDINTNVGTEVIVVPISSGSMWYAIDKVVRL